MAYPQSHPSPSDDFHVHRSIEELAAAQGVKPVDKAIFEEMRQLADGLWPSEQEEQAFRSFIQEMRKPLAQ